LRAETMLKKIPKNNHCARVRRWDNARENKRRTAILGR
jgi:hypothetical protein